MADAPKTESDRPLLVALAVCCAVPMIGIVAATSVVGVALGTAAAVAIGLIAAGVCVALMLAHHQSGSGRHNHEGTDHEH